MPPIPSPRLRRQHRTLILIIAWLVLLLPGTTSAAPPAPNPWGAQIFFEIGPGEGIVQAEEAGVQWIRYPLNWRKIEAAPGYYDWAQLDRDVAQAAQRNMRLLIYVVANPTWAGAKSCGPIYAYRMDVFAAFLEAAAARIRAQYPGIAPYWALYNEPDISDSGVDFGGCWGTGHPRSLWNAGGGAYAQMMAVAYPAIKRGDPGAIVTNGGLAYDDWYNPVTGLGRVDPKFLDEFLAAGGGQWVDAIDYHYYPAFAGNWRSDDRYTSNIVGKGHAIRAKFQAYGFDPPLIVSETGFPTRAEIPSPTEWPARYVPQVFARAMSTETFPIVWFLLVDHPYKYDPYYYGLLNSRLQPKQAFHAYKTLTTELGGYTFQRARYGLPAILEGYDFQKDGQVKMLVWSLQSEPVPHRFALPATGGSLRKVTHLGASEMVTDGGVGDGDGVRDGRVQLMVGPDPIYVQGLATGFGSISGVAFHDLNENGAWDAGETLLSNAVLNLYDDLGYLIYQRPTDAQGGFHFAELAAGDYRIHAAPPAGFTFAAGQQWVAVTAGVDPVRADFPARERTTVTELWESEAEIGILSSPMTVLPDAAASAGHYVSSPHTNYDPASTYGGEVSFEFYLDHETEYYVWTRAMGLDGRRNSFWVAMDDGPRSILEIQMADGRWDWVWQRLSAVPYLLAAGNHTLRFGAREAEARLDRVILADDAAFHPEATPTPTASPTSTPSPTLSPTPTPTASPTPTSSPSHTPSPSPTPTPTPSPTPTSSPSPTATPSPTPTASPSPTATPTLSPSPTPTSSPTPRLYLPLLMSAT